jgi:hypothetical protein
MGLYGGGSNLLSVVCPVAMHFLQALFLWLFLSGFAVGGALAFHRFFPTESPWFGFIVPPFALVLLLNFIEHFVALPSLLFLFPLLAALLIWLAARPGYPWREVMLPAGIFLGSFAFTYLIRCLDPVILYTSDGISDLNKINNFCQGGTLPPIDTWLPPFHYVWYYSLQHYAGSVVKRLFDVQLGVAYNATHAFLSALTCVAAAAAAHRLSGGRMWITIAVPFLIESAATGTTAYIQLTMHEPSMWYANNISGGVLDYDAAHAAGKANHMGWLWQWLAHDPYRERLELQAPGFWTWRDEYHANASGHLLTLLSVFIIAELVMIRRSMWPWVLAVLTPVLAVDASTWAYPLTGLLCGGTLLLALGLGRRPSGWWPGLLFLFGAFVLLWPSFYDVTSSPEVPGVLSTKLAELAPFRESLVQWWPVLLLWVCGWCLFRELSFGVRWILLIIPLMLVGVEFYTEESRYNTIEKMWGYTYGLGMFTLFPIVAARSGLEEEGRFLRGRADAIWSLCRERSPQLLSWLLLVSGLFLSFFIVLLVSLFNWHGIENAVWRMTVVFIFVLLLRMMRRPDFFAAERNLGDFCRLTFRRTGWPWRLITLVLLFSATVSLCGWTATKLRWAPWKDGAFHLQGDYQLLDDPQKARMMHILEQVKRATFLSGNSAWCYNESPTLAVFTGNRSYSAWFYFESVANYPDEAEYRSKLNNDFYSGAMTDRLQFLRNNNITGVLIWPDDAIPDATLAALTKELAPTYDYIDCRGSGAHNAGVFLLRPLPPEVRLR